MTERWVSLGERLGLQEPPKLKNGFYEDRATLLAVGKWIQQVAVSVHQKTYEPLFGSCQVPAYRDEYDQRFLDPRERLLKYVSKGEIPLLNTIEYLAARVATYSEAQYLNELTIHYNVNWCFDADSGRLHRRVLPETQEHYLRLAKSLDQACSEYLQEAFINAYGNQGSPNDAWVASRKAVEFLLHPIVSPKNGRATLTSMIRDIKSAPNKWVSLISADSAEESVLKFVQLLQMMPYEPGHHGQTPGQATVEEARMQFNLMLTVCQILLDGGFRLREK